ncbi:MAG: TlpA disulfide reductase family protein [Bacteroidota bacterium]
MNTRTKKIKKEVIEWAVLLTVGGTIYLFGWHTFIIGKLQQLFLSSGVIQASELKETRFASYDFYLEDFDGNPVDFKTMQDEVVFLNFWATWCPPCIAEMPDIHNLFEEKGEEVRFVMISLDKNREKAKAFIENKGYRFPTYFLRSDLPSSYDTHSIPTTYLLGKAGRIRVENHGMAKYNTAKFKKLMAEALAEGG